MYREGASTKNNFPIVEKNLGGTERALSVVAGSYFFYKSLKKKSFLKAALGGFLLYRGTSGYCPAAQFLGKSAILKNQNVNSRVSIVVNRPRQEVYQFWRKLENLPLFMQHLEEVRTLDEKTSAWKAKGVGNLPGVVWISEIVEDVENERIGWQSLEGSDISNAGKVIFKDIGKFSTEVNVVISYRPAYGKMGEFFAQFLNPAVEEMVWEDIRNFKKYIETESMLSEKIIQEHEKREDGPIPTHLQSDIPL